MENIGKYVEIPISMKFDVPNANGMIISRKAIEDSIRELDNNKVPLIVDDDDGGHIVGYATPVDGSENFDEKLHEFSMKMNGAFFNMDPELIINKRSKQGVVEGFTISGISITNI